MPPLELSYMFCWVLLLVSAGALIVRDQAHLGLFSRQHLRFLLEPWKLATFAVATAALAALAPVVDLPTWDVPVSVLMGTAVYLTAPWSIAQLARPGTLRERRVNVYAAAVLLFVPCWSYDLYWLIRDGAYPATWAANLVFSGCVSAIAGVVWNVGYRADETSRFAFRWRSWPPTERSPLRRVLPTLVLLGSPVVLACVAAWVYVALS